ncbi:peptidase M16 [Clostridia bacterium]|nr:peptidase M16 [Clostridia bacterium]
MCLPINREEIAESVFFTRITDSRYKTNRITIAFLTSQDSAERVSEIALLMRVLSRRNGTYPDTKLFSRALAELYDTTIAFDLGNFGDCHCAELAVSAIDDSYALEGEAVTSAAAQILLDCVMKPHFTSCTSGKIAADIEADKKAQIEEIEAELNDKRRYANIKAMEIAYRGEKSALNKNGTVEGVGAATADLLLAAYNKLLQTARIEIICAGKNDFSAVAELYAAAFSALGRKKENICNVNSEYSPLKSSPEERTEKLPVSQCKTVFVMKTDCRDTAALKMMTKIYGGGVSSKLFLNVREKLSLCYYCASVFDAEKGIMMIYSGVEESNIDPAREEIFRQWEDMKAGNFTEEDLAKAFIGTENDLKSISDSPAGITGWYLGKIYRCDIISPEKQIERYKEVTREQIIAAASGTALDTVYVLRGQEEVSSD